jgi:hypothetical protein
MPAIHDALDGQGHARVRLMLHPSGPRLRALAQAGQPAPAPVFSGGLIDTGATTTIIDPSIRQALNLTPFRIRTVVVPSHAVSVRVFSYKIDLIILHPSGAAANRLVVPLLTVLETPLSHTSTDVLVGCDVLSRCTFLHNGQGNSFELSY